MSSGGRLPWDQAFEIARQVAAQLDPYVARLKCVGSVRRRRPTVGDIEFVAEPFIAGDLLGNEEPVLEHVRRAMEGMGRWVKGGPRMMQVTDLFDHGGLTLDLFLAYEPAAWGSIVAIRTGPADLGRYVVTVCRDHGFRHEDGYASVLDTGEVVPTDTEEQFFALAGVECVPASERDELAKKLWSERRNRVEGR